MLAVLAVVTSAPVPSQERPIEGKVSGEGFSRIPIAIAPPDEGGSLSSSVEVLSTIRSDLEFTGYFDLVPEERNALITKPAAAGSPLTEWLGIGADSVLMTKLSESPGRLEVEARLIDAKSGDMVMGKRYGGQEDLGRRIAHRIADEIVQQLTGGLQGIALTRLAYVARTGPQTKEIYLMDYDGERARRLTRTGTLCLSPAWSPNGEKLAYISFRGREPGIDIVDQDGRISRVPTGGGDLNSAPDWSPDGKRLAFSSTRDGNSEIYVMELATGSERRLTFNGAIDSSPCWSPTGREIAFTSSRAGSPQIYLMDSSGGNVRRLTFEGSYNDSAAWSPRGDRIAYVSRIEGRFEILVHDLERGTATRLTASAGNNENPRWSPDGRHLVFSSSRSGTYRIYTMGADGSNPRALTSGQPSFTPDWSH
jgi:TolB protein